MEYIWAKTTSLNQVLDFSINIKNPCDTLKISAVDFYQVFVDGELISFGPNRTASGYSRVRVIPLNNPKNIRIRINHYGVETYACDYCAPFFGAEILSQGDIVYSTADFVCENLPHKETDVPKFSYQHGFLEVYKFNGKPSLVVPTCKVDAPTILSEEIDVCDYNEYIPINTACGEFKGFDGVKVPWWADQFAPTSFSVENDFIKETLSGYKYCDYVLPCEKTGFFKLKIKTNGSAKLFIVFEEILPDGKWLFSRSHCYDLISIESEGDIDFLSLEPYSFKHVKIIYKGEISVDLSIVAVQNDRANKEFKSKDEELNLIYSSAKESFCQNVVDNFTDCPTRERAGWLCDSYFMAKAEKYFTNSNDIEHNFLENFIIARYDEIEDGMLPKCFPAEHKDKVYIPNWAMWFVIELKDYLVRTGDRLLVDKAKQKVYDLVNFFDKYVNEDGLLENLKSWVFVDYSDSNTYPYLTGVNYPSNMLFAYMLDAINDIYGDNTLKERAENIRKTVFEQSYNGEFFVENAVRDRGRLNLCKDHITEAGQYYALFTGLYNEQGFSDRVKGGLGPLNKIDYPFVSRSTGFVGIYLRLLWLDSIGEKDRLLNEIKAYFLPMAEKTGTLWEYDSPLASCNHGFTSIVAKLIDKNYKD